MIKKLKLLIYNFLLKSQKITGTDNVYIAKNGTYLLIGNTISIIASFLLSIAFAQLLPKETYGQYRYILSIATIIAILSLQGINKAIIPSVAKGFENTILQAFKTKIKWGIIGSLTSIIVAGYFWTQNQSELAISLLIIAVFLPIFKAGEIYQSYLDGKKLFGVRISTTTIIQIVSSLLLFGGLFLTHNLIILVLIYFSSYSLLRLFFFLRTIHKFKPNTNNDTQLIRYGKHLSLMETIGTIAGQLDSVLLFNFLGAANLATYSYAVLTIDYVRTPLQIIQEIAVPKLTIRPNEEIKKYLPKKLIQITFLILVGIGIYFFLAPWFYRTFYPQYTDSIMYSRLFALTLLVFPMSMIALTLYTKNKTKELYKINTYVPIVQLISTIILVPILGILGAIIARLLSQFFYLFIAIFYFKKL